MGYYEKAIKDPRRKNRPVTYEWKITKEQWQYCFEDWLKEERKVILAYVIGALIAVIIVFFIALGHYDFVFYMTVTVVCVVLFSASLIAATLLGHKRILNQRSYKFFIDEQGIFNGEFYALLDNAYKNRYHASILFNETKYISYGKYKLSINENKFELLLFYWMPAPSYFPRTLRTTIMEKWFRFVFNDNDKEHIYTAINNWQKAGKIDPFSDSDREILKNYLS